MKTNKMTMMALITAIALIIFVVEAQIPPLTSVPGIKMGLSNIITVFALFSLGPYYTLAILVIRILLGNMLTGQMMALIYSFSGGMLSFLVCIALRRFFEIKQVWVLSVLAAVAHNIGQIGAAIFVTQTEEIIVYLPILIISGMAAGAFTGLCAQGLLIRLEKVNVINIYQSKHK